MSSRSRILHRIQTALEKPSRQPPAPEKKNFFAPIPNENLLSYFQTEFAALKGEFFRANQWAQAEKWLKEMVSKYNLHSAVAAPHSDPKQIGEAIHAKILTGEEDCGKALAHVDLGITSCDCLVARTGSVVLTSATGFGRTLSILPPTHLVVARPSQIMPDLEDACRLVQKRYHSSWPSMLTMITGPSRTSDIEKILVLGAHGPKRLLLLLLDFPS